MNKAWRCEERDKDGHRCTKKNDHVNQRDNLKHTAFGEAMVIDGSVLFWAGLGILLFITSWLIRGRKR